jgi:hypothetical protein
MAITSVLLPDLTTKITGWSDVNTLASIPVGANRFQIINKGPTIVYVAEGNTEPTTNIGLPLFPILGEHSKDSFCIIEVKKGSQRVWVRSSSVANPTIILAINKFTED